MRPDRTGAASRRLCSMRHRPVAGLRRFAFPTRFDSATFLDLSVKIFSGQEAGAGLRESGLLQGSGRLRLGRDRRPAGGPERMARGSIDPCKALTGLRIARSDRFMPTGAVGRCGLAMTPIWAPCGKDGRWVGRPERFPTGRSRQAGKRSRSCNLVGECSGRRQEKRRAEALRRVWTAKTATNAAGSAVPIRIARTAPARPGDLLQVNSTSWDWYPPKRGHA